MTNRAVRLGEVRDSNLHVTLSTATPYGGTYSGNGGATDTCHSERTSPRESRRIPRGYEGCDSIGFYRRVRGYFDSLRPLRMTACFAVAVGLSAFLVTGCGGSSRSTGSIEVVDAHDDHAGEQVVHIADADLAALGIEIETAGPGRLSVTAELPGEVQVDGDRMAHVAPRVGGVVREVRASLGDTVRKGQLLAVLSSRELADDKATYLAAAERLRMANATFAREERLFEGKISSEQDFLDAKRDRAEGRIEFRASEQKLLALGVTAEEVRQLPDSHDVALTDYRLLSPFDGTVIDRHITLGETVAAEDPVFTVADLSTVWIDLSVYQRDIGAVRAGQKVRVETNHGDEAELVIDFVQPLVGEETRTALARIIAPNPGGHWHPGCFVKAKVATSAGDEARVVVPESAVIRMPDGDDVVFLLTGEGFEPVVVTLGLRSGGQVEVASGLDPGERFVARGGFSLKAELGKASFGDGHGH